MEGFLSLVLHAHLPFVRHPEHARSLEETWLFEAITETYIPLLQCAEGWLSDGVPGPVAVTLTPTLCAMLRDPFLQNRYAAHLNGLIDLAEKELHRTVWQKDYNLLARFYYERFLACRAFYEEHEGDLVGVFRGLQERGALEVLTSAATHAVLPLMLTHPECIRAQLQVARDDYADCFGRAPTGIWLPECAYAPELDPLLQECGLEWFITDTHGLLNATPRPRLGTFAPVLTAAGLAAFGRDHASANQVWSREQGYPGDPRYREFYRDIGFDLDLEYLQPNLPAAEQRTFTGIKYHRITGATQDKAIYDRQAALQAADEHARHFLEQRTRQLSKAARLLGQPAIVVAPYDAELFGHWWYEGPEFLDRLVRKAAREPNAIALTTPTRFLRLHPRQQVSSPAASSWGEGGYWSMWLNEKTDWIYPSLSLAQERMIELASRRLVLAASAQEPELWHRGVAQAGRELLLAQSSDWAFILRTGTSPEYARKRLTEHLSAFDRLYQQLTTGSLEPGWLAGLEARDNIFPRLEVAYWERLSA